jgi:hypothetical protein
MVAQLIVSIVEKTRPRKSKLDVRRVDGNDRDTYHAG